MSISSNNMTHINYKNLKVRMSETNKGFWKVQSIHKLKKKLKMRYNPKDYIILKTIKKPPPKIPPFISFEHEEKIPKKLENQKNNSCGRLTSKNFFLTDNIKKTINKEHIEKTKNLFNKIYGKFIYEPYLYNEFQFFSLEKEKRLLPRKFKDVLKDSIALREYKNYISSLQQKKDANNMTDNDTHNIHTNSKKSMTIICKRNLSDNEILDNIFNEYKNEDSILSDIKINIKDNNIIRDKKSPIINIRRNNDLIKKSETEKIKKRLHFPQINIKKKIKLNSNNKE